MQHTKVCEKQQPMVQKIFLPCIKRWFLAELILTAAALFISFLSDLLLLKDGSLPLAVAFRLLMYLLMSTCLYAFIMMIAGIFLQLRLPSFKPAKLDKLLFSAGQDKQGRIYLKTPAMKITAAVFCILGIGFLIFIGLIGINQAYYTQRGTHLFPLLYRIGEKIMDWLLI